MSADSAGALDSWRDVCARLATLGDELFEVPFPSDPDDQIRGVAHLAEQMLCWVNWSVFHADPRRPFFHRQNDLITQWGGPNADNIYRHARVDASRRYVVRGQMNSCEDFMLAIRCGFMHQPKWGTVHEVHANELGIGPGDEFELVLGGEPRPGHWVPLPEGAIMASFREYYLDWTAAPPALFTIECIDDDTAVPAPALRAGELVERLEDAIAGVEHSVRNWNSYLRDHRAAGTDNVLALPHSVAKGLSTARYAFGFWDLGDDDALVIETTVPDAHYWSIQLYQLGTYELVDLVERQSSLNQRQVGIDADGLLRIIIARRDPGVANWLDAGDHRAGQFTYRFFWSRADPVFTTRVVPLADLDAVLPADTTRCTPAERAEVLAERRRHLGWRYRT